MSTDDEIQTDSVTFPVNVHTSWAHRDFITDGGEPAIMQVAVRTIASPEVTVPVETSYHRTRPGVWPAVLRYWVIPALRACTRAIIPPSHRKHRLETRLTNWATESETVTATAKVSQRVCPHVPIPDQSYRATFQREHVNWLLRGEDEQDHGPPGQPGRPPGTLQGKEQGAE